MRPVNALREISELGGNTEGCTILKWPCAELDAGPANNEECREEADAFLWIGTQNEHKATSYATLSLALGFLCVMPLYSLVVVAFNVNVTWICRYTTGDLQVDQRDFICNSNQVQENVSMFHAYVVALVFAPIQALAARYFANLSESKGRKRVICWALFNNAVWIMFAYAVLYFHWKPLLCLIALAGQTLTGSVMPIVVILQAMNMENVPEDKRTKMLALFDTVLALAGLIGVVAGTLIVQATGDLLTVLPCVSLLFVVIRYGVILFVKEPTTHAARQSAREKQGKNQSSLFSQHVNVICIVKELISYVPRASPAYSISLTLLAVRVVSEALQYGTQEPAQLFAERKFGWTSVQQGYYLAAENLCSLVLTGVLIPIVSQLWRRLNLHDKNTILGRYQKGLIILCQLFSATSVVVVASIPSQYIFSLGLIVRTLSCSLSTVIERCVWYSLIPGSSLTSAIATFSLIETLSLMLGRFCQDLGFAYLSKLGNINILFYINAMLSLGLCGMCLGLRRVTRNEIGTMEDYKPLLTPRRRIVCSD